MFRTDAFPTRATTPVAPDPGSRCDLGVFEELGDETGEMRIRAKRSLPVMIEWLEDVNAIAEWALKRFGPC